MMRAARAGPRLTWLESLSSGLPPGFDWSVIKTRTDATALIGALPNECRGVAARALYQNRDTIGRDVAYHGIMAAWDHDHAHVLEAFEGGEVFVACLADVAPDLGLTKPVRAWRGVSVEPNEDPYEAAFGVSWTMSRDIASWFALRFAVIDRRPLVFRADVPPLAVVARHHGRRERELIVYSEALRDSRVIIDGTNVRLEEWKPDTPTPEHVLARWRKAADRQTVGGP